MTHPLDRLATTSIVLERAQTEPFSFTIDLVSAGVRARNDQYANPDDHEYLVTIEDGVPVRCECPADAYYPWACKHRVAVAIRRPVLDAAIAALDDR